MKYKLSLIILIIIIVIYIISCYFNFIMPTCKYKMAKRFRTNRELFEKVVEELSKEDYIYFKRYDETIVIYIHGHIEEKVNIIKVEEKDYYKYKSTIEIIKKLELETVNKENRSINFFVETPQFSFDCYSIAYMPDYEDYISHGYKIRKKEQLADNWYYIVTMR